MEDDISRPLTEPGPSWASWSQSTRDHFAWPTWSPDRTRIASFHMTRDQGIGARIRVSDVDGLAASESEGMGSRMPIYLAWSPDGRRIGTLSQLERRLNLASTGVLPSPESEVDLAYGSPLFFTWCGDQIAAFIGPNTTEPARLVLFDPSGAAPFLRLPHTPRNFCAPVWLDPGLIYVAAWDGGTSILRVSTKSLVARPLAEVDGLAAVVASPTGAHLALATAPDGDGTPYRGLCLIDPRDGHRTPLFDGACLAFLWTAAGDALIVAQVDAKANALQWYRVELDGRTERLALSRPSRELAFYLRFFEQYSTSHPIVHPDGTDILLAGEDDPLPGAPSRILRVPLDGGDPIDLGEGVFGVYPT